MKAPPKRKRAFKANDPPHVLVVKIARSEKRAIREIAAGRSLSFAMAELVELWQFMSRKDS